MSLCRAAYSPVTSPATILRYVSHAPRQSLRAFSTHGNSYHSSKRDMQTASAYQPHTLPSSFPLPRNRGVPDTSIAADVPPSPESSTQKKPEQLSSPSNVSLREGEAQKPKPAESASTTTKPEQKAEQKPRRKLRARKAAIKMTPLAVEQLHRLVSQPDPRMVRVGVKNKGCSGLAYNLEYVEKPGTFDEVVEQDGVSILIDSKALFSIIGTEMDWQEDKLNQRFVFNNPNIKESCGCGESFMV